MTMFTVTFDSVSLKVPSGTLLSEAAQLAGVELQQPCGGQGRCGRCIVRTEGAVRRRSTLRLSSHDIASGYALACQAVVEGDVIVHVPPQEQIKRVLTTDRTLAAVTAPVSFDPTIKHVALNVPPPTMDDQTDDWSRLQTVLRQCTGCKHIRATLSQIQRIGRLLRDNDWRVSAILDTSNVDDSVHLIDLRPTEQTALWGIALDIGTTTVTLWLVDLHTGQVRAQVAEYNGQIARGEDVISRIIYASKNNGNLELRDLVLETINQLIETACLRTQISPTEIVKATVSGNSTMMHLFLNIPAESIRLSPFVTAINHLPRLIASAVGLSIHPEATVDCLPGVASYVGADISAGVLAAGVDDAEEEIVLFLDVGTNGETVLGNNEFLVTCACSAGPAFEGGSVLHGMRATEGAIEEVWINSTTLEPTYRTIGNVKPRGLCGSGLIALLAEMLLTGVVDKGGHLNQNLDTPRVRTGEHGPEYVVAWADATSTGQDIVISHTDIDNLIRAKAAIYAGFTVLADSVGIPLETISRVLVGGSFGKYINVEKAVQLGLLPDMPWDCFEFLGNTSVRGAYLALLDRQARARIADIASRMTYIELSADNSFYEAFTSALFLPHTNLSRFPTVQAAINS